MLIYLSTQTDLLLRCYNTGGKMKKRIIVLFLLLASIVMFMPEQTRAEPNESAFTTLTPGGNVLQYRYRRRYRRVYYRYRPRYRYRRIRRIRRIRRSRYHYYRRRGRLYRVRY